MKKYTVKVNGQYIKNIGALYEYIVMENKNWTFNKNEALWWTDKKYVELLADEFKGATVEELK